MVKEKIVTKGKDRLDIKENKVVITKTFKVKTSQPLLEFLYEHITNDSRNNIKHLLSNRQVLIDGIPITQFNFMLSKDDVVQIAKSPVKSTKQIKVNLDIIYEDDYLIAINKPAGLLSIESDNETTNTAYRLVMDYLRNKDKKARAYVVHRIDKETSGVLLFAKDEKIKNKLSNHWQDVVKERGYVAICIGHFKDKKGTVKSYLKNNVNNLMYSTNDKSGQLAITHYEVKKENKEYSYVDVKIDTGRKNQIRVHMKDLGHKIVGDEKYQAEKDPLKRLGLHASTLEFIHPVTNKVLKLKAKTPKSFNDLFTN